MANASSLRNRAPRPWPHRTPLTEPAGERTLVAAIEELTSAMRQIAAALGATPPPAATRPAAPWPTPATGPMGVANGQPRRGLSPEQEARIVAEATELWDTPWHELSVRELRSLVRDLPIDRSSLPAPIELLRRDELLEALHQVQDLSW